MSSDAHLRLADLLSGLSIFADLGFGLPPETAMRSCLISTALARKIGLPEHEVADTFYATLLIHVGCVGFAHETAAALGDELRVTSAAAKTDFADPEDVVRTLVPEVTRGLPPPARARVVAFLATHGETFRKGFDTGSCEVARETARRIGLGGGVQRALYEIHEWWNGGGAPQGLKGEAIALPARIARVAGDAALFDELGGLDLATDAVRRRAGGMRDPGVVDAFLGSASQLLVEAKTGDPRQRILEVEPEPVVEKDRAELPEVAAAFGDLSDLKTPFKHGHSSGVARLTTAAAEALRLDATTIARLRVAALLHDIGSVGVSDAIWEKPGSLTAAEWEQVRMHPYHSERILATSHALEPMAPVAGMHHERLDGSGYHRGCRARDLPAAARILATADAFHAMTQDRPHREALSLEQAGDELIKDSRAGRLDADAVSAVLAAAGRRPLRRPGTLRPAGLSEREVVVLRLVAQGCSNRDIAEHLYVSPRTAEHHVQHVYTKIGVSSRAAAALFAVEHNLLSSVLDA